MITFMDSRDKSKENEKSLDSQLWHACAGSMVQMPSVNSMVCYFPQGHSEHACGYVDFTKAPKVPAYISCRVSAVKFMADSETDEVYAKIRLVPLSGNAYNFGDDAGVVGVCGSHEQDKPTSFAKTLTQSDANNGGGFSVPRYCAETIFPRLDYSADPPVQTILAKDVHGEIWKFRHIYRGTPRRHLLTTGWSTFVNHKKLVAGDSIVFLRAENGDLCVGVRRAKRGNGGGSELTSGWTPAGGNCVVPYGGFSAFPREDENKVARNYNSGSSNGDGNVRSKGRLKVESVFEAVTFAARGQPFEVVYYPRAGTPEFCVKTSLVRSALQTRWRSGMRFKMPFETEDASRISWFMGTISSVKVVDPIRWPDSPWSLLQVTWDEPDFHQNVNCVSPWLVELVSNMPAIHLSPFSPPRKKMRIPQHPDFALDNQLPVPTFSGNLMGQNNPLVCIPNNNPAGMQGARHAQYGYPLSDLQLDRLQTGPYRTGLLSPFEQGALTSTPSNTPICNKPSSSENIACLLSIGHSPQTATKSDNQKPQQFLLFGKSILTEQQISQSCSTVSPICAQNNFSEGNADNKMANISDDDGSGSGYDNPERPSFEGIQWYKNNHLGAEINSESGHCKVFMELDDVGRTVDLSLLDSYEELYRKLAVMFGIESSEILNHVLYRDMTGAVKQIGDEPFSEFIKTARRLKILTDSSSDIVGMQDQ